MQILHIDTEMGWRGGENQMHLLTLALKEKGVHTHVATKKNSEISKRMSHLASIIELPLKGELDLYSSYKLSRYCLAHKVSLIDCQTSHAHSIGLLCKRLFLPNVKLVVHRRVDFPIKTGFFNRLKYRHEGIDQFVAISEKIGSILQNFSILPEKLSVVRSAIDDPKYTLFDRTQEKEAWLRRLDLKPETALIGQAAAMTDQKGYPTLIRSLAHLKKEGLNFHCIIAGDGPLMAQISDLIKQNKLENHISLLGWIDEVPSLLSAVDIFAMPSNFEGLGTTLLEAMHAGCCVVATEVGGIPEMVKHEKTGLMAAKGDDKQFAKQLKRAILDPELRKRLNKEGTQHVKTYFSLNAMIEGNHKVYKSLLRQNS